MTILRATGSDTAWSDYASSPPGVSATIPYGIRSPLLRVKQNGHLVLAYVEADSDGGQSWLTAEFDGNSWTAVNSPGTGGVVECLDGSGGWVQQGGVVATSVASMRLAIDSTNALIVGFTSANGIRIEARVARLTSGTWERLGPYNGCLAAGCPDTRAISVAVGRDDLLCAAIVSGGAVTCWCQQ